MWHNRGALTGEVGKVWYDNGPRPWIHPVVANESDMIAMPAGSITHRTRLPHPRAGSQQHFVQQLLTGGWW